MAFFQAVIRPDTPDRPEYVSVPMPSSTVTDLETRGARIFAVARWNALWAPAVQAYCVLLTTQRCMIRKQYDVYVFRYLLLCG